MIENGADVNSKLEYGLTPLMSASAMGDLDMVNLLVSSKAQANQEDRNGLTAIYFAVETQHQDIVEVLIANHAEVNIATSAEFFEPLLFTALRMKGVGILRLLIKANIDLDVSCEIRGEKLTAFSCAVETADAEIVKEVFNAKFAALSQKHVENAESGKLIEELLMEGKKNYRDLDMRTKKFPLIFLAIEKKHFHILKLFFELGLNVDIIIGDSTLLKWAFDTKKLDLAKFLLENNADPNFKDAEGRSILSLAIIEPASFSYRDRKKIRMDPLLTIPLLLKFKADVNLEDNERLTPIHHALGEGKQLEVLRLLMHKENKPDLNQKGGNGGNLLHAAITHGHYSDSDAASAKAVEILLEAGVDVNGTDLDLNTALHNAVKMEYAETIGVLLQWKARLDLKNHENKTPLELAIGELFLSGSEGAMVEITKLLIENKSPLDTFDNERATPLYRAVYLGLVWLVEALLNNGADIEMGLDSETPLVKAVKFGHKDIVALLISKGANVNCLLEDGRNLLHYLGSDKDLPCAKLLLDAGINRDCVDSNGDTPLQVKIRTRDLSYVKLLLNNGANPNVTLGHETALHHYIYEEVNEELVELLIEKGASLTAKNSNGETPLRLACRLNNSKIVELLLKAGSSLTDTNSDDYLDGETPLHIASAFRRVEIVKVLLQFKPDCNLLNLKQERPIDATDCPEIITLLEPLSNGPRRPRVVHPIGISEYSDCPYGT